MNERGDHGQTVPAQGHTSLPAPCGDVAIVGMACMFPGAPDLNTYWRNIVSGFDAITDPPAGRWDADPFYDPASSDDDRVYSQRGGYLPTDIPFDPLAYGIMPIAVAGGEVDQFLVLKVVYDALADAGYAGGLPERERAEFVLGRGNYLGPGNSNLFQRSIGIEQALRVLKAVHPEHTAEELDAIRRDLRASLPNFGPELGPTHIPNMATGRAANRLDLMGGNFTVDAACASSLIAVETAMNDLLSGKCDLAIAGGSHTFTCIPLLMVFCTLNALSHRSEIRPFDEGADGTLPGEGVGIVVLKRREDAERDGDRVYAVIKGVGSASDGRALSVMAPRLEGEVLAMRRAYERAGIDPRTIGLVEAHGTATPVGDITEIQTIKAIYGPREDETPHIAVGTVKSMIGHTMPASGVAGLIKTALALYHKVLPPTLHCEKPSSKLGLDETPLYMNTETRPWINAGTPRRAGVNAFGFGGINAHVVLEESRASGVGRRELSTPDANALRPTPTDLVPWDSELVLLGADTQEALRDEVERLRGYLAARPEVELADVAFTLSRRFGRPARRLAIVASSHEDLEKKLARAARLLSAADCSQIKDPRGIYYFAQPLAGKIAFLFPGEGSQRVNMMAQLCLHFPEVRTIFDAADADILAQGRHDPISADIFPAPFHSKAERERAEQRLWRIDRQCEAIMPANRAMYTLFTLLGIEPDMMAGHSIGEWSSLTAGGIADPDPPVEVRRSLDGMAKAIDRDLSIPHAALLAVATSRETIETIIADVEDAYVAVDNCPHQVVIATSEAAAQGVIARLRERGLGFERSRFDRGSHTPLFASFTDVARRHFDAVEITSPRVDVYSCCTAAPFPHDPDEIRRLLVRAWEQPVEFRRTVEAMYEAGARIFVEVGPRGVLSAFVDDILRGKNALALAVDLPKWSELTGLNHLVGMLTAQGLDLNVPYLYARRPLRELSLDAERDAPVAPFAGRPVVMLNLGIPMMQLSEETLAGLRAGRDGTRRDGAASTPGDELIEAVDGREPLPARPVQEPVLVAPALSAPPAAVGAAAQAVAPARYVPSTSRPVGDGGQHAQPLAATAATASTMTALRPDDARGPAPQTTPLSPPVQAAPAPPAYATPTHRPPLQATPPPAAGAAASAGMARPSDGIMAHYMHTMQGFLRAEQRLLSTLLQQPDVTRARRGNARPTPDALRPTPAAPRPTGPEAQDGPLPLLGEILALEPGRSLLARRRVDPNEDLYLHDHTFGGVMSALDPTLGPLTVAPLTISLELMAEAAAQVVWSTQQATEYAPPAALILIGMADVRAHRWVQVDESAPTVLEIAARRLDEPGHRVRVEVREVEADGLAGPMVIEGTMIFGNTYQPAPAPRPLELTNPCRTFKTAREMYDEMWMFHGPVFQGVASLDASGEDGITGTLQVLPTAGLFRSTDRPRLLTDVALLDAAGQLLGYWAKERLTSSFVVFPIRVAALHIYGPNQPVGTRARCDVRITEIMPQTVKVDMDVFDGQGRLWMRIEGWQDWRFHIVGDVYDFWRFPDRTIMSKPVPLSLPATLHAGAVTCYRMDKLTHLGQTMVTKCLAYMTLNHAERRVYHSLHGPAARQIDWLAGRIAAKDAVRVYLRQRYGLHVCPGDIEIVADAHGRPHALGAWLQHIDAAPSLSLAHTDGVGIAIVGPPCVGAGSRELALAPSATSATPDTARPTPDALLSTPGIGIDMQSIGPRPDDFDAAAFAAEELALLYQAEGAARDERRMRFWCAKEAVAKALGRGLVEGPRSVAIETWDETTGVAGVGLRGVLAAEYPQFAQRRIAAYTVRDGDHVVATSFAETA